MLSASFPLSHGQQAVGSFLRPPRQEGADGVSELFGHLESPRHVLHHRYAVVFARHENLTHKAQPDLRGKGGKV